MVQVSIITKKDILNAQRMDAEYFRLEYLEIEERLNKIKSDDLYDLSLFIKKGLFDMPPTNYRKHGVPFIRVSNCHNLFLSTDNLVFLEEKVHERNSRFELNKYDFVMSKVGTIGEISVNMDFEKINYSQNNIGIKINKDKINPLFLIVYINSDFSRKQIERNQSGNVQSKLVLEDIKNLKVPILSNTFQNDVEKSVKGAYKKQNQAKQLYKEAEQILLEELDLVGYKPKHTFTFETNRKDIETAKRFDAEYFQPKHEEIIEIIEKYVGGFDFVKNMVDWKKGVEVGSEVYTEEGKDFVRVSDFSIHGVGEVNEKISDELFWKIKDKFQPEKGEILFTKDGTIGISHVLKDTIDGVLSSAFLRIILKEKYKDFEKECLSLIFNSIISKMQIERLSGGAIINHLKPSDFGNLQVPIITKKIQKQIAEKIQESHKLRKESKKMLESAKKKVEEEIEKA